MKNGHAQKYQMQLLPFQNPQKATLLYKPVSF